MKNKIVFIIPYFGHFNNYFQFFLNSCKYNDTINWLIYTDDKTEYEYPKNVKVVYTTFSQIKERIQSKFDFEIALDTPYKLCDYKVAYGYIFQEDIKKYDYWGYCDNDVIFGNIRKFLTDEVLKNNDKIGFLGHCTVFKNTEENNKTFMKELNGEEIYKKVYATNIGLAFDEEYHSSINDIFINYNKKCDFDEHEANIYTKSSDFKIVRYDFNKNKYVIEKKQSAFFVFNKGNLIRYYKDGRKEEYMYLHIQARKMKVNTSNYDFFKIIPNSFDDFDIKELNNIKKVKIKHFNLHYFRHRGKNLITKIKKRVEG